MILRENYLNQLRLFQNKKIIKVITGIRRCGKSTLLNQFIEQLKTEGVEESQIIHINFEDIEYENLLDYKKLYEYIQRNVSADKCSYIFLDEIQKVKNFQKAVDSLYIKENIDIYITGSNSDLLSSELSSLLTGRYIEIKMMPLSFKEFFSVQKTDADKDKAFYDYLNGSLPYLTELPDRKAREIYLEGLLNTIITVDIVKRHPSVDVCVLESVLRFLLHNIGNLVSSTIIADTLTSNRRKTSYNIVEKYIDYLKECFLIYEAKRYDVKGKQHLKSLSKYYVVDNGFRNYLLSNSDLDLGHVLENVVYLELLRRKNKVLVGKLEEKEVDFVVENAETIEYYQVSTSVIDEEKLKREIAPLEKIKDNYPKVLLTLDRYNFGNIGGIKIVNVVDFLLQ